MKTLVVIPTLNAGEMLVKQLDILTHLSTDISVLIIDSSSTDDTLHIAKTYGAQTETIAQKAFNHATTRNIALKYDADFYLFMTQDALPYDAHLVEYLQKAFDDLDVVVAYARQLPLEDADPIEKFARETNYPPVSAVKSKASLTRLGIKTFFCSNSCAMYRADYFKKMGGFADGLIMNEDMAFAARAILEGKKIAYVAEAKVWHSHAYSVKDIFQRYFDIGIFFRNASWIVEEVNRYGSTEATGVAQAKREVAYLLKNAPLSIPKSILFSLTKFIAFKMGCNYKKLPSSLSRAFSLHKNF